MGAVATPLAGNDGTVEIEGTAVASMRSWTLELEATELELGGFGNDWELTVPGRFKGGGSFEGIFAYGDASGQGAVQAAFLARTLVTLTLGNDGSHENVVEAYIMKLSKGAEFDGVTTFNADFAVYGEPTSLASHS